MHCGHDTCACNAEHHGEVLEVVTDEEDGCGCDHDHPDNELREAMDEGRLPRLG